MSKIKIAIVGASGYTGSELARLLIHHPQVEISMITSESHSGKKFSDLHAQFAGILDDELVPAAKVAEADLDAVFLALPHGVSMSYIKDWYGSNFKIIDLSGDYRLSSPQVYEEWYKKEHIFTKAFDKAVYGLPELHKTAIQNADLVANPGCYPTASILSLAPLFAAKIIDPKSIIIDAKSGITGAGIKASSTNLYSNVNENFKAYGVKTHRHTIEIQEQLGAQLGNEVYLQFTPHLLPVDRGILATAYAQLKGDMNQEKLNLLYQNFYADAPFIRLGNKPPAIKEVRGTNYCDIYPIWDDRTERVLVFSAIDNLVKGAAGQAIHNMNLMFGMEETLGLQVVPMMP